jgi:FlaA1/EpsC-like NDP-sugar epimerase
LQTLIGEDHFWSNFARIGKNKERAMPNKTAFVTGGTGFIGVNLVEHLSRRAGM